MRLSIIIFLCAITWNASGQVKSPDSRRDGSGTEPAQGTSRALVIGVSSYQHIDSLQFADDDALEFAQYLVSTKRLNILPENITVLTNEKAKSGNILSALSGLLEMSAAGDKIYFYFSGHGDVEVTDSNNKGYLLVHDTPKNNYATGGISVDMLRKIFSAITEKGVKLFIVTDACRAGHLAGGAAGVEHTARSFSTQWKNEIKILSAQPDEVSFESRDWGGGRGVFSFYLVKGLAGFADFNKDSIVTLSELEQYVGLQVSEATKYKQQPVFQGPQKFSTAVSVPDKLQMDRYAKWNSDQPMTVAVIRGQENLETDCKNYQDLISILDKPSMDSSDLVLAFQQYASIQNCSKAVFTKARYDLSAALMNDVQQVVNQTLIGQKLVDAKEMLFAQAKIDSLFSLNKDHELLYGDHFRNLYTYLSAVRATLEGGKWMSKELVTTRLLPALDKALVQENNAPYLNYAKGVVYAYRFHQFDSALHYYKAAAAQSPTWLMPRLLTGMTYDKIGKFDSADRWLAGIEKMDPAFREFECAQCFYTGLGYMYLENKKYKLSEKYFRQAYEQNPQNAEAIDGLFLVTIRTGRKTEALEWLALFDKIDTTLADKLDMEEFIIQEKLLSKKETWERINAVKAVLDEKMTIGGQTEKEVSFFLTYMEFLDRLFKYYFEKTYSNAFDQLYEDFSDNAPEPESFRLKIIRIKFDHEPSYELIDAIRATREIYAADLSFDELNELDYMESYTLLSENRKGSKGDEEVEEDIKRGIDLLNGLLQKGYIDCSYIEKIRKRLRRLPEAAAISTCR